MAISTDELDRLFDEGEHDILQYFDTDHVRYPGREARTGAVEPPAAVPAAAEQEGDRTSVEARDVADSRFEEKAA